MISVTLSTLAEALGGTLVGDDITIDGICTDSRTLKSGDVFLALVGERFDGHNFAPKAAEAGAVALIVDRAVDSELPQIRVSDTLMALGQAGAWLSRTLSPRRIAITGSVGKTSVKEMTAAILGQQAKTLATRGNLNNTIGVPLTLLELEPEHRYAVLELGANHAGEIRYTSSLVKPEAAMINNIQPAHLEGFGGIEGVARAKAEIFESLDAEGTAVINLDDDRAHWLLDRLADKKLLTYSSRGPADIWASSLTRDPEGCYHFVLHRGETEALVRLPLPGRHQVDNALAAASLTSALGLDLEAIAVGLAQAPQVQGRTQFYPLNERVTVIDDSYNANLASVRAAIDLMAERDGHKVLVLGDMGELGEEAEAQHQLAGAYAAEKGIDQLLTVGTLSRFAAEAHPQAIHFATQADLGDALLTLAQTGAVPITILIKGSRSARMENLVQSLRDQTGEQN